MDYLTDFLQSAQKAASQTAKGVKYLPVLVATHAAISLLVQWILTALFQALPGLRGGFGLGIIMALIHAAAISFYLYILDHAVHGDTIRNLSLRQGLGAFLRDVYIAFFVLYLLGMLTSVFSVPGLHWVLLLALSALPETLYLSRAQGYAVFSEQFDFLKENWYIWIPVTLLSLGVFSLIGFGFVLFPPIGFGIGGLVFWIRLLIYLAVFSLTALFRGHLFMLLYQSNLRKRRFMGNFR